ncbi:type II toxin-antitoxin system VapC family toxin [Candidatus Woesearchaeota archaeon]|nr:type II toxin-antitoxin system VapC family toxin [Candidatus Woesearchaeota archaeon]
MTFVLDTSILIAIEKRDKNIIEQLERLSKSEPAPAKITFITHFEFLLGIKKKKPTNQNRIIEFLNKFAVLQTTRTTTHILSDLKYNYGEKGIALSLADLLIASLTIENNMTLVTKDKDFEKIIELKKIII